MSVSPEDLVMFLGLLSDEKELIAVVPQDFKGGLLTGTSATIGGLCGGPAGVVLGGIFGGTMAAITCKERLEKVTEILTHLKREDRELIFTAFSSTIDKANPKNYTELCWIAERDKDLKQEFLRKLKQYIEKDWKMRIYDPRSKPEGYR